MALSQVQIIQSLGEALSWFERELEWGVPPQEMNHLVGRIGELYAAMITRGQMALNVNQRGYDVISAENERISVKTVTSTKHVKFRLSTFDQVDRVIILRINVDDEVSVEELLDCPVEEAKGLLRESTDSLRFDVYSARQKRDVTDLEIVREATWGGIRIVQYENQTIHVFTNGELTAPALPVLKEVAREFGINPLNNTGRPKNTRQLGANIVSYLLEDGSKING